MIQATPHVTSDRRSTLRYATPGATALLGWKEGNVQRTMTLRVQDISLGGLSAIADEPPPADAAPLWVMFQTGVTREWVEVTLIASQKTRALVVFAKRSYLLRMRFSDSCPYNVFKDAIAGFSSDHTSRGPSSDDLRWWSLNFMRSPSKTSNEMPL